MSSKGKAPRVAGPLGLATLALLGAQGLAMAQDSAAPGQATGSAGPAPMQMVQDWRKASGSIAASVATDPALDATIATWRQLGQSDGWGFSAYANFLMANPGWPGEDRFRDLAERALNPASYDPGQAVAFFARFPPRTATGKARYALALAAIGRRDEARVAARDGWTSGTLSIDDEQRLLSLFAGDFSQQDHLRHADCALWAGDPTAAERVLSWLPVTRRIIVEARIAFQRRSPDAALKMSAADPIGMSDGGYVADKARWMGSGGNAAAARAVVANRQRLIEPVGNAERWYDLLLGYARAAANDGDWATAFAIASRLDDAVAPGTDISTQNYALRDDYTSLAWLAGTAALNKLGRPADAVGLFTRYADAARQPQTISKGYYWAGRAAAAAGNGRDAQTYFGKASAFPDQYYGQLALERRGLPVPPPSERGRPVEISAAERSAFLNRSVVRAARQLGMTGDWQDQSKMLRAIAATTVTEQDHVLAGELASSLARPDLGVMVGRRPLASGLSGYGDSAFPRVPVPEGHEFNWTMIHAIARQESQFDRAIVSRAGARGLMQLMPGTARQIAGQIGVGFDPGSLSDPQYNIRLGSTYFRQMLDYYGGCYPLAVAAYNAGPGNVNKWLRTNGDPRQPGVDMVQWIEDIPIYETRNYVQRVLENAVVYDLINPRNGGLRFAAPLSRYLGKTQPG